MTDDPAIEIEAEDRAEGEREDRNAPFIQGIPHFKSDLPYNPQRIHAAAIYCSDGRIGQHFDDFLHNGLLLPRYDRIALPGGPAVLAGHVKARLNDQDVLDELRFLIDAHEVDRVVLIQHQDCAFYRERLHVEGTAMQDKQREDLAKAARVIHRATGLTNIQCFLLHFEGSVVTFERLDVDITKPF